MSDEKTAHYVTFRCVLRSMFRPCRKSFSGGKQQKA
uniref:Bm14165 n=1 Tax=Brugia malayi TaxID=6279 RepID=A0A1I9G139_BRUMA|nr:Bm14165 [Brugia malayi]